eukprot:scaffold42574_cov65-Attheya_sp.AAC.6
MDQFWGGNGYWDSIHFESKLLLPFASFCCKQEWQPMNAIPKIVSPLYRTPIKVEANKVVGTREYEWNNVMAVHSVKCIDQLEAIQLVCSVSYFESILDFPVIKEERGGE